MPFRKMSFLNRTVIPTANGLSTLSVPLVGGRENKDRFMDVRIDNSQRWQVRHWRTITAAYRRSPWFEFYEPGLAPIFETRYEKLADWNLDLVSWTMKSLKSNAEIILLLEQPAEPIEMLDTIKPASFQDSKYIANLPVYPQVFEDRIGFQPNMSIIDLIFNEGNNSRSLLGYASS